MIKWAAGITVIAVTLGPAWFLIKCTAAKIANTIEFNNADEPNGKA